VTNYSYKVALQKKCSHDFYTPRQHCSEIQTDHNRAKEKQPHLCNGLQQTCDRCCPHRPSTANIFGGLKTDIGHYSGDWSVLHISWLGIQDLERLYSQAAKEVLQKLPGRSKGY
jgi:hypothetical protein